MYFIKLFDNHSGYTEYTGGDMLRPNVSHCIEENDVHYGPTLDWTIKTRYLVEDISEPTMIGGGYYLCGNNMDGLTNVDKLIIDGVEMDVPEPNRGYFYQFASTGYHTVDYVMKKSYIEEVYNEETDTWSEVEHEGIKMEWIMFNGCNNLFSMEIPNSVVVIEPLYLKNCSLISVNPSSIYYDSRNNCNAIIDTETNMLIVGCNNTVIPNTVTSIRGFAFGGCSGLTSVVIPDSVTSIEGGAFEDCSSLTSVICNGITAPTIQNNTFRNIKTNGTLTVPSGSTGYDVWMGTGNYYLGKYGWTKVEQ